MRHNQSTNQSAAQSCSFTCTFLCSEEPLTAMAESVGWGGGNYRSHETMYFRRKACSKNNSLLERVQHIWRLRVMGSCIRWVLRFNQKISTLNNALLESEKKNLISQILIRLRWHLCNSGVSSTNIPQKINHQNKKPLISCL